MTSGMRKGLTSYGDKDFSLFLRKAFIKAMGYSDDALDRPIIGITNTYSDFNPCHGNVPQLIEAVKRGAMLAGAMPMEFPTISIHESFAYPTSMFLRNLMAMDTEEMMRALPVDAVVLIGGCDKTTPAQVMAAVSADRPTIVLPVGPMLVGHFKGEVLGACTDCRRLWGEFRGGRISAEDIEVANERLAPSIGTCGVMGTASTIACMMEAMGMTLPGAATIPAPHADRIRMAEATGKQAAVLAKTGGPKPSDIITKDALHNAIVVLQSIGGSTNGVVHLSAIAGRTNTPLTLEEYDEIGKKTPVLVDLKPSGDHYMEHFHYAGGVPRLMQELKDLLVLDAKHVMGGTLGDAIKTFEDVPGQTVIKPRNAPLKKEGGMAILRGNLCPRGAVIKQAAASPKLMQHEGRAVVFESVEDMTTRIDDPALDVTEDDVIVMRNAGPIGAPGMPEAGYIPIPKKLAQKGVKDMVRLSDARMSGTAFGTIVLHIAPESAVGGPLALVKTGDRIRLDVANRSLELLVSDAELEKRRKDWTPPPVPEVAQRGYAKLYRDHVQQADEGCDFDFLAAAKK
ncbi:IlvD/Edd family dehydratase [Pseudorhodoplanes sp.]|uniref:IlvD/Edd family dehydratase n=1 Tax=Pseudorhodoplanes sp. TaxID=1934341 RepID=UPI002BF4C882|nr:IlvD/Edd family dehydratase [Pseudorhodoplanes sp.]HWV53160.1 IlvD/Edd family dehydratase [Pseudorhodoplanes sp.]